MGMSRITILTLAHHEVKAYDGTWYGGSDNHSKQGFGILKFGIFEQKLGAWLTQ